jgi:hypothetical protein
MGELFSASVVLPLLLVATFIAALSYVLSRTENPI